VIYKNFMGFVACGLMSVIFTFQANAQNARNQNYSLSDANYVVQSSDRSALAYVVCLEGAFNRQPRRLSKQRALDNAVAECGNVALRIRRGQRQRTIENIRLSVLECGFRPEDATPGMGCGEGHGGDDDRWVADVVYPGPRVVEVGKWLEGISYDGGFLWATESGQRTTAKIDFQTGRLVERYRVGRLPVQVVANANGSAHALVSTDKKIVRLRRNGSIRELARLNGCPEEMVSSDPRTLWVLASPDCSSGTSNVIRIDTRSGRQIVTGDLGEWALDIIDFGPDVWVSHARALPINIVNKATMDSQPFYLANAELWALAKDDDFIYGGGRPKGTSKDGVVVKINPLNTSEVARTILPEMVVQIASDGKIVYALSQSGKIWLLSARDLTLLRSAVPATGTYQPTDAIVVNGRLVVSSQQYRGEDGAVLIFDDLVPADWDVASKPGASPPATTGPKRPKPALPPAHGSANTVFPVNAISRGGTVRRAPSVSAARIGSSVNGGSITLLANAGGNYQGYPWFSIRLPNGLQGYQWGGAICTSGNAIEGIRSACKSLGNPTQTHNGRPAGNPGGTLDANDVVVGVLDIFSKLLDKNLQDKNAGSTDTQIVETPLRVFAGRNAVQTSGALARNQLTVYAVNGKAGQTLQVDLTATRGSPTFEIYVNEARNGGTTLAGAGPDSNATSFRGQLPSDGVFKIVVGSMRGASAFQLSVKLEKVVTGNGNNSGNARYIGTYESRTAPTGNIERNGNGLMWTDFDGRSFALTVDRRNRQLVTDTRRPRTFDLDMRNGKVVGFKFGRHTYTRMKQTILPSTGNANPRRRPKNSCDLRGKIVSTSVREGAVATFANSRDSDIHIYWISYQGKEVDYSGKANPFFSLVPDQFHQVDTRVGFAFVVVDGRGNCIDVVQTDKMDNTFEFLEPPY